MVSRADASAVGSSPLCSCSAPQQRGRARRVHLPALGGEHPYGRGVDVAEEHPLDAALHERDPTARGRARRGRRHGRQPPGGGAERDVRGEREHRTEPRAAQPRRQAGPPPAAGDEAASAGTIARSRPGWVNSAKMAARCSRSRRDRSGLRSICGRTCSISRSYCTPDGQAVTQAMQPRQRSKCSHRLGRERRARLVADPHQHDAAARRVGLVLEHGVAGAGGQAESTVDAVADEVGIGRARSRPRRCVIRSLPRTRRDGTPAPGRTGP